MYTVADKSQTLLHPTLRKISNTVGRSNAGDGSGLKMRREGQQREEGRREGYLTSLNANRNGIDNDESHQKPLEPVI